MIISGQAIAEKVHAETAAQIAAAGTTPRAAFVAVAPTAVTCRYLERKRTAAAAVGIQVTVVELTADTDTVAVQQTIQQLAITHDAVVVQLPLPATIAAAVVCDAIPATHDVDCLRSDAWQSGQYIQPVAGAIAAILAQTSVVVQEARAVVVGYGKLVGQPVAAWLQQHGAVVEVVTEATEDMEGILRTADIVVSGAGVPGLLQPAMLKPGCVLIDAATSEQSGKLAGDADPTCAEVAGVFTPVPGGVGPATIAVLLRNIAQAALPLGQD